MPKPDVLFIGVRHGGDVRVILSDEERVHQCAVIESLPQVVYHSPTGFEWGYRGSGPADLALSILAHMLDEYPMSKRDIDLGYRTGRVERAGADLVSVRLYHAYKADVIAHLPHDGWQLSGSDVCEWVRMALATNIGALTHEARPWRTTNDD